MTELKTTWRSKLVFFLLCATFVLTTLAYGTVHQPTIALFYLTGVLVIILWAFDSLKTGVFRFHSSLLQIPIPAAALYGIVQIIPFGTLAETAGVSGIPRTISVDPFWTQFFVVHFVAFAIFFAALLTFIDSAERIRKMGSLITFFGFAFAFFAILQYVLSPKKIYGVYEPLFAQPFGSFVNRHNFAAWIEMAISIPLGLMFAGAVHKDKRLLYFTAIGLMGVALLLSGSRGGLFAFLAQIFFFLILTAETRNIGRIGLKIGLVAGLLITIIIGAMLVGGETSLSRIAETATSSDVTTNRAHIWKVSLEVVKNSFPLGAGIGGFAAAYTKYDTSNGAGQVEQAHNDYLQILTDTGIIGLIIAGFFIYLLFKTGLQSLKTENVFRRGIALGAFAGCFSILVHSVFDFVLHTTAITYFFLILVTLLTVSGREFADDIKDYQNRRRKRRKKASVIPIGRINNQEQTP